MKLEDKIKIYSQQIELASISMSETINQLLTILREVPKNNTIFMTGIGKSYHIVRKSVATWQCLNINAHSLLVQDMSHGDFGILKDNDVVIHISKSGNTTELIENAHYIKNNFNIKQICITNSNYGKLKEYMDYTFNICDFEITEADQYKKIPTISSVLFMIFLDLTGIELSKLNNFSLKDLKKNHPNGLGKDIYI